MTTTEYEQLKSRGKIRIIANTGIFAILFSPCLVASLDRRSTTCYFDVDFLPSRILLVTCKNGTECVHPRIIGTEIRHFYVPTPRSGGVPPTAMLHRQQHDLVVY